jgi:uncharacterized protein YndB with AHSA1/START domain
MEQSLVATATVTIKASVTNIWRALLDPETIKQYMLGADVASDWQVGSSITWKGEYEGKKYSDYGVILKLERGKQLSYSHFSPQEGKKDIPENYHTVTIDIATQGANTVVTLSQDKNPSEEARKQSEKNWQAMLESLKKILDH